MKHRCPPCSTAYAAPKSPTLLAEPKSPSSCCLQLREAEERTRYAFAAVEAKRQEQVKQFAESLAGVESGGTVRMEALELALREQGNSLKETIDAGHRTNRRRSDEIHAEVQSLESRLRTTIADAQEDESVRVGSLLRQAQEQVKRSAFTLKSTLQPPRRSALPKIVVDNDSHLFWPKLDSSGQSGGSSSQASHRQDCRGN